ncbi:HdeD family acid-resistance protein [Microvirga alba]|uniref:HdeD family acid-resistance protein n=1 Tax=Microvirga alba TaxID=2791025 RepID=A0A931FR77_9HYPH|nr:HdeD family acid-resistance protein [Microvirga alba]MBF9235447.1 HdeD family acid-resistance protein [Microvirga alba]
MHDDQLGLDTRWVGFLLLGIVLMICGGAAVWLPSKSTVATSTVLGAVLAIAGAVTIVQTFQVKEWAGFVWQLLCGAAEVVGGLLIWLNPIKGAAAITLLVAIVLVAQGLAQLGLAFKIRPQRGWGWLGLAGLACIAISAMLVLRFPFPNVSAPGAMAGVALILAGIAYMILAVGRLKARSEPPS